MTLASRDGAQHLSPQSPWACSCSRCPDAPPPPPPPPPPLPPPLCPSCPLRSRMPRLARAHRPPSSARMTGSRPFHGPGPRTYRGGRRRGPGRGPVAGRRRRARAARASRAGYRRRSPGGRVRRTPTRRRPVPTAGFESSGPAGRGGPVHVGRRESWRSGERGCRPGCWRKTGTWVKYYGASVP